MNAFKEDNTAFLFNLTCSRYFPSKGTGKDLKCKIDYGPSFSGGGGDLVAGYEPFNGPD